MVKAVRFHETGGPEVLRLEDIELADPAPGEVRVRHVAIGLNFIDCYHRGGLYPLPLPSGIGMEGAGIVDAVGEGVRHVAAGDPVCYANMPLGAYAEARIMPAAHLVKLPEQITFEQAAAVTLKGMTVQCLIRRIFRVEPGMTVLFHAIAGGVGLIACQWLKHLGAEVIGTVGSEEKAAIARAHGCDHPIVYGREDFRQRVRELTGGAGVPVVYDSVGAATFEASLDCLAKRGMMVTFGNASGPPPPVSPGVLAQKGSLSLIRPSMPHYTESREELEATAAELFEVVRAGDVTVEINQIYPLAEAARAHRELEARATTGSSILIP